MITGPTSVCGLRLEPQSQDIEPIDEHIDDTNDAVLFNVVIDTLREHRGLVAVLSLDKSSHPTPLKRKGVFYLFKESFHTASARNGHQAMTAGGGGLLRRLVKRRLDSNWTGAEDRRSLP